MINIQNKLNFEKKVYFFKYIFKRPLFVLGDSMFTLFRKPSLWMMFEFFIAFGIVFRKSIFYLLENFPLVFDKYLLYMALIILLTFVYKVYESKIFQEDYKKYKEEKIKKISDETH